MKKAFALSSLTGFCMLFANVYAGDGTTVVTGTNSALHNNRPYQLKNNIAGARPVAQNSADIRPDFLLAATTQPDLFKNMTFRSAITGAGIMGAIMGGKIAAKIWLSPHVCFAPGANIGSKSADFTLTF